NLRLPRHIFQDCKKTFSPSPRIAQDNSNISHNLKYTIAQELQKNISLTFLVKKHNLFLFVCLARGSLSVSNTPNPTIAQKLQENISLTFIAKKYNLSISSVQRIMDECYSDFKVSKDHLPETICID
ncbi:hypothetical protein ACW0S9_02175, partial [Fusobacterium polymorphum]